MWKKKNVFKAGSWLQMSVFKAGTTVYKYIRIHTIRVSGGIFLGQRIKGWKLEALCSYRRLVQQHYYYCCGSKILLECMYIRCQNHEPPPPDGLFRNCIFNTDVGWQTSNRLDPRGGENTGLAVIVVGRAMCNVCVLCCTSGPHHGHGNSIHSVDSRGQHCC